MEAMHPSIYGKPLIKWGNGMNHEIMLLNHYFIPTQLFLCIFLSNDMKLSIQRRYYYCIITS